MIAWHRSLALLSVLTIKVIADSIPAPSDAEILRVENRTPECPFQTEYSNGPASYSIFHISYIPSPFDTITKLNSDDSITCRLVLELGFNLENVTVAVRDAVFRANVNLGYDDEAKVEMSAVWWARTAMVRDFTWCSRQGSGSTVGASRRLIILGSFHTHQRIRR